MRSCESLGARVGKNDLVAGLETAQDFDRVDGAAAEFHRRANRFGAARDEFENADGAVLLAERGPADIDDIIEPLELDRSVDAQVGTRAFRQFAIDRDIDRDGPLLDRGIDADDVAFDDAVAGIDRGLLVDLNVFRLRLRDLDLRFQFRRIGDASEIVARLDALADFHRQLLQHAGHAGSARAALRPGPAFNFASCFA